MDYARPEVRDYGTILEITAAVGFSGNDDGGVKNARPAQPHHTSP